MSYKSLTHGIFNIIILLNIIFHNISFKINLFRYVCYATPSPSPSPMLPPLLPPPSSRRRILQILWRWSVTFLRSKEGNHCLPHIWGRRRHSSYLRKATAFLKFEKVHRRFPQIRGRWVVVDNGYGFFFFFGKKLFLIKYLYLCHFYFKFLIFAILGENFVYIPF